MCIFCNTPVLIKTRNVTTIIAMMAKRRIQKVRQTQRWECRFFRTVEWCHDSGRLWKGGEVSGDLDGEVGDMRKGGKVQREEDGWREGRVHEREEGGWKLTFSLLVLLRLGGLRS
jgi:hypothetical protein